MEGYYYSMAHGTFWGKQVLKEKSVMIFTAISLVFLSLFKIIIATNYGSNGLLSEGLENLTDLIKIFIIYLGMKYNKDRMASLVIIAMMIFTGLGLLWNGISSLIIVVPIESSGHMIIIAIISIILNSILLFYKGFVGRMSGNLSLLSDSKDSALNVKISAGVLIGIIFARFGIYWIDPIFGILIALLCLHEGIEIFYEIWKEGEDFDITTFKVAADDIISSRLTTFLLHKIKHNKYTKTQLKEDFIKALERGRKYFGGFADYFNDNMATLALNQYLKQIIKSEMVSETSDEKLKLTDQGEKFLEKKLSWEKKHRKRKERIQEHPNRHRVLWIILNAVIIATTIYVLILIF